MKKYALFSVSIAFGMLLVVLTGCTTRGDTGRLFGAKLEVSVLEDSTFATSAKNQDAGHALAEHKPATETRGFRTIGGAH